MTASMNEKYVNYEAFGAIGDGKHDDFEAIAAAHAYANENGLDVKVNGGKVYFIGKSFDREIPVETNIDFGGSEIIIDDSYPEVFARRSLALFSYKRKKKVELKGEELVAKIGENVKISRQDKAFPWIVPLLEEDSMIRVTNEEHRDFVRFGSNQNNGNPRQDIFIVKMDGTLDPSTEVAFEFDKITGLEIFPERETPLVAKNGHFASICCRCAVETNFENRWRGHERGFVISRADVTIENITHRMIDEPPFIIDEGPDELSKRFAKRNETYPYEGFIVARTANRLTIKDCLLTSHTTYYEDKPATESTGWKVPNPVPMGTYDMYFHYSNATSLINVKQNCPTGIGDRRYWGIMASNQCKNFYIEGCYMNRFDSHRGFWNAVIKDSTIGHSINITGGGHLYMENVTKLAGNQYLSIRGDYGSSFEGDIVLKNCHHAAEVEYNSTVGGVHTDAHVERSYIIAPGLGLAVANPELYYNWDFGYDLFLPIEITVDNFTTASEKITLYTDVADIHFNNSYKHSHAITEKITVKNMDNFVIAENADCKIVNSIPVVKE